MVYPRLIRASAVLALFASIGSPAVAKSAWDSADTRSAALKWELGYLALGAVDTALTIDCINRNMCIEGNPIMGKRPSPAKLILGKVALSAVHFAVFNHINGRNPKVALRLAQVSFAVQGGVVGLNARFAFN